MGFLDDLGRSANKLAGSINAGLSGSDDGQARRRAEQLFHDYGVLVFRSQTGTTLPSDEAETQRVWAELTEIVGRYPQIAQSALQSATPPPPGAGTPPPAPSGGFGTPPPAPASTGPVAAPPAPAGGFGVAPPPAPASTGPLAPPPPPAGLGGSAEPMGGDESIPPPPPPAGGTVAPPPPPSAG